MGGWLTKSKLLLYNTFEYNTNEDFIYYILFVLEQLNLNPETINLVFLSDVIENDELHSIAYKYIRNVTFGNRNDTFTYKEEPTSEYSNFSLIKSL